MSLLDVDFEVDDRTGLKYVGCSSLPGEVAYLFEDILYDKATGCEAELYYCNVVDKAGSRGSVVRRVLLVTAEAVYLCNECADIMRCVRLDSIACVWVLRRWVAIVPTVPRHDILIRVPDSEVGSDLARILCRLQPSVCVRPHQGSLEDLQGVLQLHRGAGLSDVPPAPIRMRRRDESIRTRLNRSPSPVPVLPFDHTPQRTASSSPLRRRSLPREVAVLGRRGSLSPSTRLSSACTQKPSADRLWREIEKQWTRGATWQGWPVTPHEEEPLRRTEGDANDVTPTTTGSISRENSVEAAVRHQQRVLKRMQAE
eukprot:PhM_4_TR10253/c0_g1_i1/m.101711